MAKYLQVTLLRATGLNATTYAKSNTKVHATASFKNIVYKTSTVEEMGLKPVFNNDGSNVFHFTYEDDNEFITFELFNRKNACIGKSTLTFVKDLEELEPGKAPKLKTLIVKDARDKQAGELFLKVQLHHHQVMGEQGNLKVELKEGYCNGITSILTSKTTKVLAKLIYKHTTLTSGILNDMGNKFKWFEDNTFLFLINNNKLDDVLEIEVYNRENKVGGCKIFVKTLLVTPGIALSRNGQELLNNKKVGSIDIDTTFILPISNVRREEPRPRTPSPPRQPPEDGRRQSCPPVPFEYYPPEHHQIPPAVYPNVPQVHIPYPPLQHSPNRYHRPSPADQYAPSAPPPPANHAQAPQEAHGAPPPSTQRQQAHVHHPLVQGYIQSFHW